jgi:glycosyltransferase involved in cell wall biosynthesis
MSAKPLVSIVTPSYNQARFLEKTMRSVLDQDYNPIEYLVVDGGSTDHSVDLIRKYENKLAWWVSEKDSGQAEAINKGLARAKGEIVAWLNSDDYYMPGAVTAAVKALQDHPQAGFVYGDVRVVGEDESVLNQLTFGDFALIDLMSFKS